MTNLLKKSGKFECPAEAKQALNEIKRQLLLVPILKLPDLSQDFCLQTDASGYGIGAILLNINSEGVESIVQYASRSVSEAEKNTQQLKGSV